MNPILLRTGFDTIEIAIPALFPPALYSCLADAKELAIKSRKPQPTTFNGQHYFVHPNGGQGGYEYLIGTGPFGLLIKIRGESSNDVWTTHAKFSAHGLATKGLVALKSECDIFLESIGAQFNPENIRLSRADYALDFFAPDLEVKAEHVISHARMTKDDLFERVLMGDRTTYLRVGKMPNRQVCIYDKTKAISDKRDLVWEDIFARLSSNAGLAYSRNDIWRVEFRVGKNAIEKYVNPRFYNSFLAVAEILFLNITESVRWVTPIQDSNRSRWPENCIWEACRQHFRSDFLTFEPVPVSNQTLKQIAQEYVSQLEAQTEGLALTIAAMFNVPAEEIADFVSHHFSELGNRLTTRADLEDQLRTRRERQMLMFGR